MENVYQFPNKKSQEEILNPRLIELVEQIQKQEALIEKLKDPKNIAMEKGILAILNEKKMLLINIDKKERQAKLDAKYGGVNWEEQEPDLPKMEKKAA